MKAVNLDKIMRKFSEHSFSTKIKNSIRAWNGINIGQQLRVERKKGKENIHKRNKKQNIEVLFARKPSVKCDRKNSIKPTPARPSWSLDDVFRFRTHRGRASLSVYHQRARVDRKRLNIKLSDLKLCKSCDNCSESTPNRLTIPGDSCERNSYSCEKFARTSLKKMPKRNTVRSMERQRTSLNSDKANTKQNIHENTGIQEYFDVGCGDGSLMQEIQTYCTGTNPEFPENAYDDTNYVYNQKLRRPLCRGRNTLSNLLGYILCGLIAIVWSPCVITYLFFWFITYPLRPQPVGAPLYSGDDKKRLGSRFRTLSINGVLRNITFKNVCAVIQSKFRPKLNHSHALNSEQMYPLYHKNGKVSVIKPAPDKTIRHQPHIRDKRQTDFLYDHNDVIETGHGKKLRNEHTAGLYSDTGWSTHRNETVMHAFHEHYPLATMNEQRELTSQDPCTKRTVQFPCQFGKSTVSFKEPYVTLMGNAYPSMSTNYGYKQDTGQGAYQNEFKYKKQRKCYSTYPPPVPGHCSVGAYPSRHCTDFKTRHHSEKKKVIVRCTPGQTTLKKHASCICGNPIGSYECPEFGQYAPCENACGDFVADCGKKIKRNKCKQNPCREVKFCIKRKRLPPVRKKTCIRYCRQPCQNCWKRFKCLITSRSDHNFVRPTLNRDLTAIRPSHIFFGLYGDCCCAGDFFKSCWRMYKGMCSLCLVTCAFIVWGPVFFCIYIIFNLFCFWM